MNILLIWKVTLVLMKSLAFWLDYNLPQLTRDQLVICYDLISTTGGSNSPDSSPYYNIFLNTAAVGEILADFQPANVTSSTELLSTYVAYLALCLGLSQSDTSLLISTITAPAVLSTQNLATLYAYSILSVALGLQVSDLLILLSLAGPDLLTTPEGTLHFIADLAQVRTAQSVQLICSTTSLIRL